jgi:hypothetical protein
LLGRLPKARWAAGMRRFVQLGSLHDAMVTACWFEGSDKLKVQVQPELPDERLVLLEYTLARDPFVHRDRLPPEYRTDYLQWMYDELGVFSGTEADGDEVFTESRSGARAGARSLSQARAGSQARSGTEGDGNSVFTHNILLSNGWELEIAFSRLKVTRHQAVWPVSNRQATIPPIPLPRTG